jgi:hypothetical protein
VCSSDLIEPQHTTAIAGVPWSKYIDGAATN